MVGAAVKEGREGGSGGSDERWRGAVVVVRGCVDVLLCLELVSFGSGDPGPLGP